jgi:hypothetical protein
MVDTQSTEELLRSLPVGSRVAVGTHKVRRPYGFLGLRTRTVTEPLVWTRYDTSWICLDEWHGQDSAHLALRGEATVLFRSEPAPPA